MPIWARAVGDSIAKFLGRRDLTTAAYFLKNARKVGSKREKQNDTKNVKNKAV